MFQAFSCDAVTGALIDEVPVSAFTYNRLLSAGGNGTASIPLDGTHTKLDLRDLLLHRARMLRLDRDGRTEYMGIVNGRPYQRGRSVIGVRLQDLWSTIARRGAWDHNAPNMELWSTTVTGSLAQHAAEALIRGRTGPALPAMGLPVTIPGFGGTAVTREHFGYHHELVGDVHADLMDEGLDIYYQPRRLANGDGDWLMHAGPAWVSGVEHEFYVTADDKVLQFSEDSDASRVTNNARNVGEGSEQDMLVRSNRNTASPYPLLDRVTERKNITDVAQLAALSNQDLVTYGDPTFQWDLTVTADAGIDVGDVVRLHFDGDPWIADGWHERRVVSVSGDLSEMVKIGLQPTGGA